MRMRTAIGLGLFGFFASCRNAPELANGFDADVVRDELKVTQQDYHQVTVQELLEIAAPAGASISHARMDWLVNGEVLRTTDEPLNVPVQQDGRAVLRLSATLPMAQTLEEIQRLARKKLELRAHGVLSLLRHQALKELEISKKERFPSAQLLVAHVLQTSAVRYQNGELTLGVKVGISNSNGFAVNLTGVEYELEVAGARIGQGAFGQGETIAPGEVYEFTVEQFVDHSNQELIDEWKGRSSTPYGLHGEISCEAYSVPFELTGAFQFSNG